MMRLRCICLARWKFEISGATSLDYGIRAFECEEVIMNFVVKKILNFDYPTASGWNIRQIFPNLKVGIRIFFVIRRFLCKNIFL
jgi:hypothetical protein